MSLIKPITATRAERWDSTLATSTKLEDYDVNRAWAVFYSDDTNTANIFLNLATEAIAEKGICIAPGGTYEINDTNWSPAEIHAICAVAGQKLYYSIGIG